MAVTHIPTGLGIAVDWKLVNISLFAYNSQTV